MPTSCPTWGVVCFMGLTVGWGGGVGCTPKSGTPSSPATQETPSSGSSSASASSSGPLSRASSAGGGHTTTSWPASSSSQGPASTSLTSSSRALVSSSAAASSSSRPATGPAYYVRSGATGHTCSDWGSNACPDFPSSLVRGAIYYVASGNYGSYLFDTPESGSQVITILKATAGVHGTGLGWDAAWGQGPAVFGNTRYQQSYWDFAGVNFSTGYWTFDGSTGAGPNTATYGFTFKTDTSGQDEAYLQINQAQTATFLGMTLGHVAITCSGSQTHSEMGLMAFTQANVVAPLIHHLYVDNCQVLLYSHGRDWVIEDSFFMRQWSGGAASGLHGVPVQDSYAQGTIFRRNVVRQCSYICIEGETQGQFYNNIFDPHFGTPEGIISGSSNQPVLNTQIAHNTVVNSTAPLLWQQSIATAGATGNVVENNLLYHSNGSLPLNGGAAIAAQCNVSVAAPPSPFVDLAQGDFHLLAPTAPGITLPAPLDVDWDGYPRGADGVWDVGAFEYRGR